MQCRIIGISFTADGCTFSGSKIDRTMSYYAIDRRLGGRLLEADEVRIPTDSEQFRQKFAELAQSGRLVAPRFGGSDAAIDNRQSVATYSESGNSHIIGGNTAIGTADATSIIGNIIQITVATFIELAVQPHHIRISSGGGGGSDRGGWNDKEKNEYKPRRRR